MLLHKAADTLRICRSNYDVKPDNVPFGIWLMTSEAQESRHVILGEHQGGNHILSSQIKTHCPFQFHGGALKNLPCQNHPIIVTYAFNSLI